MPNTDELKLRLEETGLNLAGPVVLHFDDEETYYAFVKVKYVGNGKIDPSNRKLERIRRCVVTSGYNINFVSVREDDEFDYSTLNTILDRKYNKVISNVFLTRSFNSKWLVWVEIASELDETLKSGIQSTITNFMKMYDLASSEIVFVGEKNYPTPTAILRTLRTIAPASSECLRKDLEKRNFFVPDQTWLNRELDKVRKAELVVRRKDGGFFLSVKCLNGLGSSTDRNSADVRRALAISRKFN